MTPKTKTPTTWWQWWPLLLGFAGMFVAYQLDRTGPWNFYTKLAFERAAIVVTVAAVVLACIRLAVTRERFHLLLLAVAMTVLLREIHWEWTTKFVYISLAAITIIAVLWRDHVFVYVDRQPAVRVWLTATAITYVLSQAIARRAFRGVIPNEDAVHTTMEEFIELVSHTMLVVTVLVGPWVRAAARGSAPEPVVNAPDDAAPLRGGD